MTLRSSVACLLVLGLVSGCDTVRDSQFNPINWFSSDEETLTPVEVENERRPLVAEITSLEVERTPGGAIIRATALPTSQGWFAPELVSADPFGDPVDGVLSFAFRAVPPQSSDTGLDRAITRAFGGGLYRESDSGASPRYSSDRSPEQPRVAALKSLLIKR